MVDAGEESAADAVEIAEEGAAAGLEAGQKLVDGGIERVAVVDEFAVGGGEVLEAGFENVEAGLERFVASRALVGEECYEFVAKEPLVARGSLTVFEHFEMGEAEGPGEEGFLLVVGGKLAIDGDAGFLHHVFGVFAIWQQAIDVAKQVVLMANEEADEELIAVGVCRHRQWIARN